MQRIIQLTADELAMWLHKAKAAHTVFEDQQGEPDADWPEWYANYIAREAGFKVSEWNG